MPDNALNRRKFLKNIAATGMIGTGVIASTGTVAAREFCAGIDVYGESGLSHYGVNFDQEAIGINHSLEDNDVVDYDYISGVVNGGWDGYKVSGYPVIESIGTWGSNGEVYMNIWEDCSPALHDIKSSATIEVSGVGDYSIGYWGDGWVTGHNLEGGEIEYCVPSFSNSGDPQLTCYSDIEGVVDTEYGEMVTGEVKGDQYVDTYTIAWSDLAAYQMSPDAIYLNGDINIDITYND